MNQVELIMHPVRLRILLALTGMQLTTQELADRLDDVPVSSLYRHLRLLRKSRVVDVVDTHMVNGIREKVYTLQHPATLSAEDMQGLTADEHFRYFTTYVLTLLHGYSDYLERAKAEGPAIDLMEDQVGYREIVFYASDAEMENMARRLNQAVFPLLAHDPREGRRKRKLATISHPLD